jgi:hypothetical protein
MMDEQPDIGLLFEAVIRILFICSLFEIGLLIFAYTQDGKVECNFLWCTFTTTKLDSTEVFTSESRTCSINNEPVNCSDIDSYYPIKTGGIK